MCAFAQMCKVYIDTHMISSHSTPIPCRRLLCRLWARLGSIRQDSSEQGQSRHADNARWKIDGKTFSTVASVVHLVWLFNECNCFFTEYLCRLYSPIARLNGIVLEMDAIQFHLVRRTTLLSNCVIDVRSYRVILDD